MNQPHTNTYIQMYMNLLEYSPCIVAVGFLLLLLGNPNRRLDSIVLSSSIHSEFRSSKAASGAASDNCK